MTHIVYKYILSPDVKFVKGANRSCLYDLKRREFHWISEIDTKSIDQFIIDGIIDEGDEFFKFALKKELIIKINSILVDLLIYTSVQNKI